MKTSRGNEIFMTKKEVLEKIPIANSTLYLWIQQGTFPAPKKLGERMARWDRKEIETWIANKLK